MPLVFFGFQQTKNWPGILAYFLPFLFVGVFKIAVNFISYGSLTMSFSVPRNEHLSIIMAIIDYCPFNDPLYGISVSFWRRKITKQRRTSKCRLWSRRSPHSSRCWLTGLSTISPPLKAYQCKYIHTATSYGAGGPGPPPTTRWTPIDGVICSR